MLPSPASWLPSAPSASAATYLSRPVQTKSPFTPAHNFSDPGLGRSSNKREGKPSYSRFAPSSGISVGDPRRWAEPQGVVETVRVQSETSVLLAGPYTATSKKQFTPSFTELHCREGASVGIGGPGAALNVDRKTASYLRQLGDYLLACSSGPQEGVVTVDQAAAARLASKYYEKMLLFGHDIIGRMFSVESILVNYVMVRDARIAESLRQKKTNSDVYAEACGARLCPHENNGGQKATQSDTAMEQTVSLNTSVNNLDLGSTTKSASASYRIVPTGSFNHMNSAGVKEKQIPKKDDTLSMNGSIIESEPIPLVEESPSLPFSTTVSGETLSCNQPVLSADDQITRAETHPKEQSLREDVLNAASLSQIVNVGFPPSFGFAALKENSIIYRCLYENPIRRIQTLQGHSKSRHLLSRSEALSLQHGCFQVQNHLELAYRNYIKIPFDNNIKSNENSDDTHLHGFELAYVSVQPHEKHCSFLAQHQRSQTLTLSSSHALDGCSASVGHDVLCTASVLDVLDLRPDIFKPPTQAHFCWPRAEDAHSTIYNPIFNYVISKTFASTSTICTRRRGGGGSGGARPELALASVEQLPPDLLHLSVNCGLLSPDVMTAFYCLCACADPNYAEGGKQDSNLKENKVGKKCKHSIQSGDDKKSTTPRKKNREKNAKEKKQKKDKRRKKTEENVTESPQRLPTLDMLFPTQGPLKMSFSTPWVQHAGINSSLSYLPL